MTTETLNHENIKSKEDINYKFNPGEIFAIYLLLDATEKLLVGVDKLLKKQRQHLVNEKILTLEEANEIEWIRMDILRTYNNAMYNFPNVYKFTKWIKEMEKKLFNTGSL